MRFLSTCRAAVLAAAVLFSTIHSARAQDAAQDDALRVDFHYAPPVWLTPIGFPDDWQKSLVDHEGALAYDFGPGPYVRSLTTVSVGAEAETLAVRSQRLLAPRVPVVLTALEGDGLSVHQEAFALAPPVLAPPVPAPPVPAPPDTGRVQRRHGYVGSPAWAQPEGDVDPAFRSVAWGTGRPIEYIVDVPPASAWRVALGFAEAYRRPGRAPRVLRAEVEGAPPHAFDLTETGARHEPQVFFYDAEDADGDGRLRVVVTADASTQDPNTILSGLWLFAPGAGVTAGEVIDGRARERADVFVDAGREPSVEARGLRRDVLRARFEGRLATPVVRVETRRELTYDAAAGLLRDAVDGRPFVRTRPAPVRAEAGDEGWRLVLPAGTDVVDVLVVHGGDLPPDAAAMPDVDAARAEATAYWEAALLPWGRITVPDSALQALLDGSIRTLYQVREVVDGRPQFQPGATVYRGLWYGDNGWMSEAALLAGDTAAARLSVEAMLQYQDADGRTGVMVPPLLHRETAHLLWAAARYARLSGDRGWLRRHWSAYRRAVGHLQDLRERAKADPEAPYYGLLPPGLTDGGVGGVNAEYGSVYWGLIAMNTAAETARWLGETADAEAWQAEYDDFLAAFRRAAARDVRTDEAGNRFLPMLMQFDPERHLPQRGQWGVLHAAYVGHVLAPDDPLVEGTLAMLDRLTAEDHVQSLGWLDGGVWPIFDAHRALTYNELGEAGKAVRLLYAFANHASPLHAWVEEQMPQGEGTRTTGDVPHAAANAQMVRLLRYLLVLERGDVLSLLHSLPPHWLRPGATLRLDALPTAFGPLTLSLTIDADGHGRVAVEPVGERGAPGEVVLSLDALRRAGYTAPGGSALPEEVRAPLGEALVVPFRR